MATVQAGTDVKVNIASVMEVNQHPHHGSKLKYADASMVKTVSLTARERRFIKFASVEYEGQLFMTPQDFLESMLELEPRPRVRRRILTRINIEQVRLATPQLKRGSSFLFRSLRDKGIISYTEYLFLLSILTKPQLAFHIAFRMFDTNGNQRVELNEFMVIHQILGGSFMLHEVDENTRRVLLHLVSTEDQAKSLHVAKPPRKTFWEYLLSDSRKFRFVRFHKRGKHKDHEDHSKQSQEEKDVEAVRRREAMTTLQAHLFGPNGDNKLHYQGFHKFMDDLQREVLEIEFNEYAKGHTTISEMEFAKILLRYSYMDTEKYGILLDRLLSRSADVDYGLTFSEFMDFCNFLNNLEDFVIAMRLYTFSMQYISREEFSRAVKICTGLTLSNHLVDTIFSLFDVEGNGMLAYKDFVNIMQDRISRGFKSPKSYVGVDAFKICVNNDLKYG